MPRKSRAQRPREMGSPDVCQCACARAPSAHCLPATDGAWRTGGAPGAAPGLGKKAQGHESLTKSWPVLNRRTCDALGQLQLAPVIRSASTNAGGGSASAPSPTPGLSLTRHFPNARIAGIFVVPLRVLWPLRLSLSRLISGRSDAPVSFTPNPVLNMAHPTTAATYSTAPQVRPSRRPHHRQQSVVDAVPAVLSRGVYIENGGREGWMLGPAGLSLVVGQRQIFYVLDHVRVKVTVSAGPLGVCAVLKHVTDRAVLNGKKKSIPLHSVPKKARGHSMCSTMIGGG